MSVGKALEHLETAEMTILSWWSKMDEDPDEDGVAEFTTMLAAVLRSVARAAGALERDTQEDTE